MKKTVLSIISCIAIGCFTNAQNVSIPDANFKAYLVGNSSINTNNDTEIQTTEANVFTGTISITNMSITDLTGIEAFTNLTKLDCSGNPFTNFDISQNTGLTHLWCNSCSLTDLDVTQNSALNILHCSRNNFTSIDLSNNPALNTLHCFNGSLTSLDVSQNISLRELRCNENDLTSLNVANGRNGTATWQLHRLSARNNPNLTCIQHDTGFSPSSSYYWFKDATAHWSTDCSAVLVSSITVVGQGGITTINTAGGTLQMEATVLPANATDGSYTWSVDNQSGAALIDANGLLTPQTDGTVIVRATANDGSGVVGSATIGISNQTAAIENLALENIQIHPNPVNDELFIDAGKEKITSVNIISLSGKVLKTLNDKNIESMDLSNLPQGVYFVKVSSEKGTTTKKIVKK